MASRWPRRMKDMTPLHKAGGSVEDLPAESPPRIKSPSARQMPKRVSEITPFKSDSDDEAEDGANNDALNLNCARRLTNSDYMDSVDSDNDSPKKLPDTPPLPSSPSKSAKPASKTPPKLPAPQNENNRNQLNSISSSPSSSSSASSTMIALAAKPAAAETTAPIKPPKAPTVAAVTKELQKCALFTSSSSSTSSTSSISFSQPKPHLSSQSSRPTLASAPAPAMASGVGRLLQQQQQQQQQRQHQLPHQPSATAADPPPMYRQMKPSHGLIRQQAVHQPPSSASSVQPPSTSLSSTVRPKTAFEDKPLTAKPGISIFKNIRTCSSAASHARSTSNGSADDATPPFSVPPPPPPSQAPTPNAARAPPLAGTAQLARSDSLKRASGERLTEAAPPSASHFKTPSTVAAIGTSAAASASSAGVAIEYTVQRPQRSTTRFAALSRSNSSKQRSQELRSEFQSQPVLFHTPSVMLAAGARNPLRDAIAAGDHSLDLSLDDSVMGPPTPAADAVKADAVKADAVKAETAEIEAGGAGAAPPPDGDNVLHINGKTFVVQRKIGSGGSSTVYLSQRWDASREEVAIKVVDLRGDAELVTGYVNETKLLAKLQGDASVIRLFEYVHVPAESTLYVVMERGDHDLHHVLRSTYATCPMPLYVLMRLWHQMLLAVAYIHRNGVIHSDLKPANFLLVAGRLKLIDFGIASNIATDSTSIIKFSQAGTFNYVSPEALIDTSSASDEQLKIKISTKSDVWSLGCILYLLLYKRTPFAHINNIHTKVMTIVNEKTCIDYPALPNYVPGVFLEMLQRCLVYAPKQRVSVAELLQSPYDLVYPHDALGLISEQPPPAPPQPPPPAQPQPPPQPASSFVSSAPQTSAAVASSSSSSSSSTSQQPPPPKRV